MRAGACECVGGYLHLIHLVVVFGHLGMLGLGAERAERLLTWVSLASCPSLDCAGPCVCVCACTIVWGMCGMRGSEGCLWREGGREGGDKGGPLEEIKREDDCARHILPHSYCQPTTRNH